MSDVAHPRNPAHPSEARCRRCGESFEISDALLTQVTEASGTELLHARRRNGDVCGGVGVPFRKYVIRNPNRG